jgi:hypothetical protein
MTSFRQFEANRRNALRSTGPKTEESKRHSRLNAMRHGLTAETVVASLEDAEDYKTFEAAIIADYCAETAVARELVCDSHRSFGAGLRTRGARKAPDPDTFSKMLHILVNPSPRLANCGCVCLIPRCLPNTNIEQQNYKLTMTSL